MFFYNAKTNNISNTHTKNDMCKKIEMIAFQFNNKTDIAGILTQGTIEPGK